MAMSSPPPSPAGRRDAMEGHRQLVLLGMLLLGLHVIYGVTAIIGMAINHTLGTRVTAPYDTHIRWQIATFWIGAFAYMGAAWLWIHRGLHWPVVLVALWVAYRLVVNAIHWRRAEPIERWW